MLSSWVMFAIRRAARIAGGIALVAAVAIGATGCSSSDPETSGGSTQVAGAGAAVRHLDPAAFAEAMQQPGTVLVDVRTPQEYEAGHLPKATNIDMEAADFAQRIAKLDKSASYALYCHSGRRSGIAADQMQAAGFTKVVDLAGGVTAWTAAGRALTTG